MLLSKLVETSQWISDTTKRLEKTALLAGLLKSLSPAEVEASVGFLSGAPRQGRLVTSHAIRPSRMQYSKKAMLAAPFTR